MPDVRKLVYDSLANAVKSGYLPDLLGMTPRELAYDLIDQDSDICALVPDDMTPCAWADQNLVHLVKTWQDGQSKET